MPAWPVTTCLHCQDSPTHYCLHGLPWKMRSDHAPQSRCNSGKRAYAEGESVKDSTERLKPPKRERYAATDAKRDNERRRQQRASETAEEREIRCNRRRQRDTAGREALSAQEREELLQQLSDNQQRRLELRS